MIWVILAAIIVVITFGWWGLLIAAILIIAFAIVTVSMGNNKKKGTTTPLSNVQSGYKPTVKQSNNAVFYASNSASQWQSQSFEKEFQEARAQNANYSRLSSYLGELSNKGNALEKIGDIDAAIEAYEQCVEFGEKTPEICIVNYMRDIDRLVVLYRKKKEYQKEVDIIELALSYGRTDAHSENLRLRQRKAKELLNKTI